MIAPDTSVLVAGFATWHEGHEAAVRALNRGVHLIAHAAVETYSVLTRLPPPHRIAPVAVHAYLADYDALVGFTAKAAGAKLLTRDLRAVETYERLRVEVELVT